MASIVTDRELAAGTMNGPKTTMSTLVMRAHSRMSFRNCRRRWAWLDGGLGYRHHSNEEDEAPIPALWFGSAFHFAMEDFHGYRVYGNTYEAFMAYAYAAKRHAAANNQPERAWPDNIDDLFELGGQMLDYYERFWLPGRELDTVWIDGVPQVELEFDIDLNVDPREWHSLSAFDRVVHQGTIDRLVHDPYNKAKWWELDYKTAKRFEITHLDTDSQVSAYLWGGSVLYPNKINGMLYQQHKKTWPNEPKVLSDGKLSTSAT